MDESIDERMGLLMDGFIVGWMDVLTHGWIY